MHPLRRVATLACALFFAAAGAASADPALWVVESPHAKVYLFGTVHVLRPQQSWHTAPLDAALAESAELWLEVTNADDPQAAAPIVRSLGIDAAHPLSTKLSKTDLARVDNAAKAIGAPAGEAAFEPFRPWLASLTFSVVPLLKAGYDPKSGVDMQLKSAFQARGKPVRGFETIDQQMHFFADLPADQEVALLDATLDRVDSAATVLDSLVAAWSAGDVDRFAALENDDMFRCAPGLYDRLVVQRNAAWARQLDARLHDPGISFVAVGAAHLAGAASVQSRLAALGYRVRRVQ
ncbi:hypothetical protein WPS_05640 [Vulcanimicrobium alpinum]|uniref:TraB/GumN family protein n=1 Tax=Vulcanimicrobium alpinum TaxID=3016050 RepID=A0AAN1XW24_UNVUL|nr:TraB/GumN family protein [Vulcanimicrobium alpinum]BDE05288.1 hypothetical protein WPS_05640 [Vulcanimicrobium alpinum]